MTKPTDKKAALRPLVLDVKGLALAALAHGPTSGAPVLALHGWLDNAQSFARLRSHLPDCHLVALDFPGHGHSAHRPCGSLYHFSDYVSDAIGTLDALGWASATLLGHSMGAGVASLTAVAAPERVARLILIEGFCPLPGDPQKAARSLRESSKVALRAPAAARRRFDDVAMAVAARRLVTPGIELDVATAIVERNLQALAGGYGWRTDPRLRAPSPQPYTDQAIVSLLEAVACPALLIEAEDGLFKDRPLAAWVERFADLRHLRLPGGHHLHTTDVAPAIAAAVREFMLVNRADLG